MTITALHVGGPTLVLDIAGLRILTDPTFDPPGPHPLPDGRVLTKLAGPALPASELGVVDLLLLSHDQHSDNLDTAGREVLTTARRVLSTPAAAERIDAVEPLASWESVEVGPLTVTAVPARHGPPGAESFSGPVTGFVLRAPGEPTVYVSGDNASVGVVERIAERIGRVDLAVLFCGAARRPDRSESLTLTATDAVLVTRALGEPTVLPIHADGWLHFTESAGTLHRAFAEAGLADRLTVLPTGTATTPALDPVGTPPR